MNFVLPLILASSIVINEFLANPSSGNDWIELYNPTQNSIDLTNWNLWDSTSLIKSLSGSLGAGEFLAVDVSNRLNNSADSIFLKDSNGVVDSYSYNENPGVDVAIGREPDGQNWAILTTPTKGAANSLPIASSSPSLSPSPSPSPSPTPEASAPNSSFLISNIPTQLDVNSSFAVSVNLDLPDSPNKSFYLKGAFAKSGSANYFGKTLVLGSFVKNSQSAKEQLPITLDGVGKWSGLLIVSADLADSGFTGSGTYLFKVGRYNQSGADLTWSNQASINILGSFSASLPPVVKSTLLTTKPSVSPKLASLEPTSASESASDSALYTLPDLATVSGVSTQSSEQIIPINKGTKQLNLWYIGACLTAMLGGIITLIYVYQKFKIS